MPGATVRTFAPELWGQVDIFSHFHSGTHTFDTDTRKAISGVNNHFRKACIYQQLASKLLPNFRIDEVEIQSTGYTSATNAKEFSAVLEGVFTELYSSVDCTRKIIVHVYKRTRGLSNSTRKMFHKIRNDLLGNDFPKELREVIKSSDWYEELLSIRDELTHSDIGNCWMDKETNKVTYMHTGINRDKKPLIIKDVMNKIQTLIESINKFLGSVFLFLNAQLKHTTIDQLCGIFNGRGYLRKLAFEQPINLNSGVCQSHEWFDNEIEFMCPLANTCGAYIRAKSNISGDLII